MLRFLITFLLLGLLLPDAWLTKVWNGEVRGLVLLAFLASFMQNAIWPIASQMAEAQRESVRVNRLNALIAATHLGIILLLWKIGRLTLPLIFIALALEWAIAGWLAARLYWRQDSQDHSEVESPDRASTAWREFWHYCKPFVPYTALGFVYAFADRWMLQHWGGATEQAFYAVAAQFATVVLLATTSILRIFWKEIAEAYHRKDRARMERLYLKVSRGLYFVSAVVAGGLLPWAGEIIKLVLGTSYSGGATTLMLMFLYPVHQSMGQIGGTMLYATGHTRAQVVIGLFTMLISLVVAYFMMAPSSSLEIPGLALASKGLAYKMLMIQVVQVNVVAWFIARRILICQFDWGYQVVGLAIAALAGFLAKLMVINWISAPVMVVMSLSGPPYLVIMAAALYLFPWMAGVGRADIHNAIFTMKRALCNI